MNIIFQDNDISKPVSVMESNVDAAEWKLEVERVLPLLKVHIRTDNKVSNTGIPVIDER